MTIATEITWMIIFQLRQTRMKNRSLCSYILGRMLTKKKKAAIWKIGSITPLGVFKYNRCGCDSSWYVRGRFLLGISEETKSKLLLPHRVQRCAAERRRSKENAVCTLKIISVMNANLRRAAYGFRFGSSPDLVASRD